MHHQTFAPKEIIFLEGQEGRSAYRVISGKVEIFLSKDQKEIPLAEIEPGDIFGEMAILQDRPRSASARAVESTIVEVLTDHDFNDLILKDPKHLLPYLASFFERLRHANDQLQRHGISQALPHAAPSLGHIPNVKIRILNELTGEFQPDLLIPRFPFRIGRALDIGESEHLFPNDLSISDKQPFMISRCHCSLIRVGRSIFVRDRGSKCGTSVNGKPIGGEEKNDTSTPLQFGENFIRLGSATSPHVLVVTLS